MALRPMSRAIALMTLGVTLLLTSCSESPVDPTSVSPRVPKAPDVSMTAPVEGVVRSLDGSPVEGARVRLATSPGSGAIGQTRTDQSGRFQLPSVVWSALIAPVVLITHTDHFEYKRRIPRGAPPAPIAPLAVTLQPVLLLLEGVPLRFTLTNDDVDYGLEGDGSSAFGERGPVKVMEVRSSGPGPWELRAEWMGSTRLHLWAERYYDMDGLTASGTGSAALALPRGWASDGFDLTTVSVGLPRSARASGGLPAPVDVTITLRAVP